MYLRGVRENEREDETRGPRRARKKTGRPRDLATEAIAGVAECLVGFPVLAPDGFRWTFGGCFLGLGGGGALNRIRTASNIVKYYGRLLLLLSSTIISNIFFLLHSFSLPIYTGVICSGLNEVVVNFLANQRVPDPRGHSSSP